jgi:hypothetical protein
MRTHLVGTPEECGTSRDIRRRSRAIKENVITDTTDAKRLSVRASQILAWEIAFAFWNRQLRPSWPCVGKQVQPVLANGQKVTVFGG